MKLTISPEVREMFPHVKLGVLVAKDIRNTQETPAEVTNWMRNVEKTFTGLCPTVEELARCPRIEDWREAYRKFGFKPNQHRCSVEALCRRVVQGKELPQISTVVDIYNGISVKHTVPVGGDDCDLVDGTIVLAVADGSEKFVMLGDKTETIKKGEIVYRDDKEVLCRSWNYRESEKSKITEKTKSMCLVVEGLEHTSREAIERALGDLREMLQTHCGGRYETFFLDCENPEATW